MISCRRLPLLLFLLPTVLIADTYRWLYSDSGSEDTGSATKTFECSVQKESPNVQLVMVSSWNPGATIEIHGLAMLADVKDVTETDGSHTEQITFHFEDSFGNAGVGTFRSRVDSADLELTVTEAHPDLERSKVARQYRDIPIHLKPAS